MPRTLHHMFEGKEVFQYITPKANIICGEEAVEGIIGGVNLAADLIRPTYGGGGSNSIIETKLKPGHRVANDAWTIIKDIAIKEPAERIGLEFVKELTERQDRLSGDARKTTIILLSEILKQGYKANINKLELKRELDSLIPFIENEIDKQTRQISIEEVKSVAQTSSESEEIGTLLQSIYKEIGKSGIIQCEGSGTYETSYRIIDGVRFEMTGYLSPQMANKGNQAVYENPLILVTKKKIATDDDINPLLKEMLGMEEKKALVIFTQDMDPNIASMLVDLHKSGRLNVVIIKAPTLWRDYVFEDFAKCTGATIIEDASGKNFKNMHLTDLGTCGKITVDGDETILTGTKDISEHTANLEAKADEDSKLRLSWLTNKTAILKLGANSETDLSYKLLKTFDAIRSSELALKYGVVKGGGQCLISICKELPKTIGGDVMSEVLEKPYRQIIENGIGDIAGNVVDSAQILKTAIRNAIGVASTILTASSIVYIPEQSKEDKELEIISKRNPFQ